jgi:hypothetical protein
MSWITLTTDDVYHRMAADELLTLSNIQLQAGAHITTSQGQHVTTSSGQKFMVSPPVLEIVQEVVTETSHEVRASVMAGGYDTGDSPKIPEVLKGYALSLIPMKLWSRIGGENLDLGGSRQKLYERALEVFRLVEQGKYDAIPTAGGTEVQEDIPSIGSTNQVCF